jgi:hypothetical protein
LQNPEFGLNIFGRSSSDCPGCRSNPIDLPYGNLGLGSGIAVPACIGLPFTGKEPKHNNQAGEKASGRVYIWIGHILRIVIFSIFCPRAAFGINIYGRLFIKQRMSINSVFRTKKY